MNDPNVRRFIAVFHVMGLLPAYFVDQWWVPIVACWTIAALMVQWHMAIDLAAIRERLEQSPADNGHTAGEYIPAGALVAIGKDGRVRSAKKNASPKVRRGD